MLERRLTPELLDTPEGEHVDEFLKSSELSGPRGRTRPAHGLPATFVLFKLGMLNAEAVNTPRR